MASPWFHFLADGKERWCQVDGFVELDAEVLVFEIKLSHTANAWWQLQHLYIPVLRKFLGTGKVFRPVELCKWFDPGVGFPEPFRVAEDLYRLPPHPFLVHVWPGK